MKWRLIAAAATSLLLAACAYENPAAPVQAIPPASAPATIKLSALAGIGNSFGDVFVDATVTDAAGKGVAGAIVRFTTTAGTMQPDTVTADGGGLAQTKVVTSAPATVTATAGQASAQLVVTPALAPPGPAPPPAPTPTPAPVPTPTPAPGPRPIPLPPPLVTLSPITTTVGIATLFSVGPFMGGLPVVHTSWSFGDGGTAHSAGYSVQYTYGIGGNFRATVTATDEDGRTASASTDVTVNPAPTPAPTPQPTLPSLAVTLTCTPRAPLTATVCNVAATYGGANIPSDQITDVDWDWGDGTIESQTPPLGQHPYVQTGTYLIVAHVRAKTVDGVRTALASQSIKIP